MIDVNSLDFDAIPRALDDIMKFLEKRLSGDVPAALGDEPTPDDVEKVNTYLERQRDLSRLILPGPVEPQGDMKGFFRAVADEVERLGNITGSGAVKVEQSASGIGISIQE